MGGCSILIGYRWSEHCLRVLDKFLRDRPKQAKPRQISYQVLLVVIEVRSREVKYSKDSCQIRTG